MSTTFSSNSQILIVDRNPNVRDFLKRELTQEGFSVLLAGTGKELLGLLSRCDSIDLLILDPDIPDIETHVVIEAIRKRLPDLPIIVHGFISDVSELGSLPGKIIPIEKQGNSVDQLKDAIARLFTPKLRPDRNPPCSRGCTSMNGSGWDRAADCPLPTADFHRNGKSA